MVLSDGTIWLPRGNHAKCIARSHVLCWNCFGEVLACFLQLIIGQLGLLQPLSQSPDASTLLACSYVDSLLFYAFSCDPDIVLTQAIAPSISSRYTASHADSFKTENEFYDKIGTP